MAQNNKAKNADKWHAQQETRIKNPLKFYTDALDRRVTQKIKWELSIIKTQEKIKDYEQRILWLNTMVESLKNGDTVNKAQLKANIAVMESKL